MPSSTSRWSRWPDDPSGSAQLFFYRGAVRRDVTLIRAAVIDQAWKIDHDLVKLLLGKPEIKKTFFDEIEGHWIFNINTFIEYISEKNFLANSYTRFRNKIGLTIDGKFLRERGEVSLVWPYKDCVLEGGQAREEEKRKEIFFNEILAQDEIDRLFDPKVLNNFKRYTANGEQKVTAIKRDKNGTIRENLIIKGNNLLALHSLKKQFRGKVKLIYIDPPYNTGNDSFGYNDNFNHSSWLTFIKNRLEVAKELLRDDGVIFISCDDNEQAYLKILMDEVFKKDSFVGTLTWISTTQPDNIGKARFRLQKNIEYILFYSKCKRDNLPPFLFETNNKNISYPYTHNGKPCRYEIIERAFDGAYARHTMRFKILGKSPREGKQWQIGEKTARELEKVDKVAIIDGMVKRVVYEEDDIEKGSVKPFYSHLENTDTSQKGKSILKKFFEDNVNFETVKPIKLIKKLMAYFDKNSIILDFFAGSGTTANAVLELNKEDGGCRKYILVEQLNEHIEICMQRVRKVIYNNKHENKGDLFKERIDSENFIYCELMQYNEAFMDKIQAAKTSKELEGIWKDIAENSFLNWYVNPEIPEEAIKDFREIGKGEGGLEKQRKLLAELLNKNQLYVNLSEIDDADFKVSETDRKLNRAFYGEGV